MVLELVVWCPKTKRLWMLRLSSHNLDSPPTLGLHASEAAMDEPLSYLEEVTKIYLERRNTLVGLLQQIPGITVSVPLGAFYCLVKLPVEDTDVFAKWILTSFNHNGKTVMVAPASGFMVNVISENR